MNEKIMMRFPYIKEEILKKYPEARTKVVGGKFILDDGFGKAIIPEYPDLAACNTVYDAWKNALVVSHWKKIEKRSVKKFKRDVSRIKIDEYE